MLNFQKKVPPGAVLSMGKSLAFLDCQTRPLLFISQESSSFPRPVCGTLLGSSTSNVHTRHKGMLIQHRIGQIREKLYKTYNKMRTPDFLPL
ncbi:hypothetical protein E2C01_012580 [Portunus trituberculatus]|uniref:Uncharacterized protein n=1 Tax=Portunus trituberculatus TaxID=210409 RepID=A0A5B7DEH8_PORTR|nr:hypothetical protein [Portunus trituberculatus]